MRLWYERYASLRGREAQGDSTPAAVHPRTLSVCRSPGRQEYYMPRCLRRLAWSCTFWAWALVGLGPSDCFCLLVHFFPRLAAAYHIHAAAGCASAVSQSSCDLCFFACRSR